MKSSADKYEIDPSILEAICRRAGLRFHRALVEPLTQWVNSRTQALSLNNPADYFVWLGQGRHLDEERPALSHLASSRETFFLRDHGQIEILRRVVLPELIESRSALKTLRLWSVGCSTGEEVYTLAILLQESGLIESDWHLEITGFDIDLEAIQKARQGLYRDWSFRGCPDEFRRRYFHAENGDWKINPSLQKATRFETLDILAGNVLPQPVDLILCRNVFIYLAQDAIQLALSRLVQHLTEGGYLFCAPGELAAHPNPELTICAYPEAVIYRKTPAARVMPTLFPESAILLPPPMAPPPTAKPPAAAEEIPSRPPDFDFQEILGQAWNAANQGRLDESARLCAQARAAQPLSPDSYYLSAILALAQGAAEVARDELRRVLYLAPDFVLAYPMLTELYSTAQDDAAAERYCRQGLTHARSLPPELRISAHSATTAGEITAHLEQLASQLEPPNSQG